MYTVLVYREGSTIISNTVFKKEEIFIHQEKLLNSISEEYKNLDEVVEELNLAKYLEEISFPNDDIAFELKCLVCYRIKNGEWKIKSFVANFKYKLIKFCEFLKLYYPDITSILEVSYDKLCNDWEEFLDLNGINAYWYYFDRKVQKDYKSKTSILNFSRSIYGVLTTMINDGLEWEKDIWNVLEYQKYGVKYNQEFKCKSVNFRKINQHHLKEELKVYFKEKLIDSKEISWNTFRSYLTTITKFFNYLEVNNIEIPSLSSISEDLIKQYENYLAVHNSSGTKRAIKTISTIVNNINNK